MAAPNIVNVATITGKTGYLTPSNTTANVLLANAASSGKVFKVNQIVCANVNGSAAVDTTVALNTNAAGSGTSYSIVPAVSVPAKASLIGVESTAIYLEEDESIIVTSGTASGITYTISYEEIS